MRTAGWATLGSAIDVTTAAPGVAELTALPMAACTEMPVSLVAPAALPRKPRCDQPAVRSAARWRSSFLSTLLTLLT